MLNHSLLSGKRGYMVLTEQQKKEKVKDLRPIDDVFFEVLADFLKGNKTIYHVEKVLRETGEVLQRRK